MLNRFPRGNPALSLILDDLANPHPEAIGKALGVHPRTVQRWLDVDAAPRPALLALWWLTRWGQSTVDSDVRRVADLAVLQASGLAREVAALRHELARVLALADTGAANDCTLLAGLMPHQRLQVVKVR